MDDSTSLPRLEIGVGVVIVVSDSCLYIIGGTSFRAHVPVMTIMPSTRFVTKIYSAQTECASMYRCTVQTASVQKFLPISLASLIQFNSSLACGRKCANSTFQRAWARQRRNPMIVASAVFQVSRVQFISHNHKLGLWGSASVKTVKMKGPPSLRVTSFSRRLLLFCTVEPICDWWLGVQVMKSILGHCYKFRN